MLLDEFAFRIVSGLRALTDGRGMFGNTLCGAIGDVITLRLVATGDFERTEFEALDAMLRKSHNVIGEKNWEKLAFIDVGANIGLFSIRYARHFKRVLALEVNPITALVLRANLKWNDCNNVDVIEKGASSKRGKAVVGIPSNGNLGWASIEAGKRSDRRAIAAAVDKLDAIAASANVREKIGLIKIDVEGHEREVLIGAAAILRRDRPVLLYEQLTGAAATECRELLRKFGYSRFYRIGRTKPFWNPIRRSEVFLEEASADEGRAALIVAVHGKGD